MNESRWSVLRAAFSSAFIAFALCGINASFAAEPEVVASGLQFPEGAVFVGNTLYFVDYSTSDVLRLVDRKVEKVWHQDGCGANGLVQVGQGLLVACYENGTVVRISLAGKTEETIASDDKGQPFLAPNDLAADARGGVYFTGSGSGSMLGKVYYRGVDKRVREVASKIRIANGLAVSIDGKTLYVAESGSNRLLQFDIAADGGLSGQREFVKLGDIMSAPGQPAFTPDGVRIDKHGNLFIGLYRGGGFAVVSPAAKLLALVSVPEPHHANLAISPDGRSVFLTAARFGLDGNYVGKLMRVPNPLGE
jgi:gluconolactonase